MTWNTTIDNSNRPSRATIGAHVALPGCDSSGLERDLESRKALVF